MSRFIILVSIGLLFIGTASAQVTCTRTGDQVVCNGSLQQPRPAAPRVHFDPYGSRLSGYEAGVRDARAQNVASATQMYFNGKIPREDRERFLNYISKHGGDVIWFRNDMEIKDQQEAQKASVSAGAPRTDGSSSRAEQLQIQLLEAQLAKANLDLENSRSSHVRSTPTETENAIGRFTGKKERLKLGSTPGIERWNCQYSVGSSLIWRSVIGSCPNAVNVP